MSKATIGNLVVTKERLLRFLQLWIDNRYILHYTYVHIFKAFKSNVHDILKTESGYSPSPTSKLYD